MLTKKGKNHAKHKGEKSRPGPISPGSVDKLMDTLPGDIKNDIITFIDEEFIPLVDQHRLDDALECLEAVIHKQQAKIRKLR